MNTEYNKNSSPSLVRSTRTCFDLSSGALDRLVTVRFIQCQCCSRHARRSVDKVICSWIHDRRKNVPIDRRPTDFLHPPRPFQNADCDRSINAYRGGFASRRHVAAKWYVALKVTLVGYVVRDYCPGLTKGNVLNHCKVVYYTGIAISVRIRRGVAFTCREYALCLRTNACIHPVSDSWLKVFINKLHCVTRPGITWQRKPTIFSTSTWPLPAFQTIR